MDEDLRERFRANATGIASTLVTGLWLGLLVGDIGGDLWLAVLIVGYVGIVPAVAMLFDDEVDEADEVGEADESDWANNPGETDETGTLETGERQSASRVPSSEDRADALTTLRTRYAAGELTDEQFEHKLERLLEVETLEDAEVWGRERDETADEEPKTGVRDRSVERE